MNISEKKLENSSIELSIDVPAEQVDSEYKAVYNKIQKTAKIDGFRKGMVPMQIIEAKYKEYAHGEVAENLARAALYDAITEKKLTPMAAPYYELGNIAPGEVFSFKATFEVPPTVELGKYKDISAEERVCTVSNDDVMSEVDSVREKYAEITKKDENAQVEKGDMVKIQVKRIDDVDKPEEAQFREYTVVVGKSKDEYAIDKQIAGMKSEEEKNLTIKYPKNYYMKDMAGQKAEYIVKIVEISSMKMPELNDEFAKKVNYETKDEFILKTREFIEKYVTEKARGEAKAQILKTIVENSKFDIPHSMIESEMQAIFRKTKERIGFYADNEDMDSFIIKFGINGDEFKAKMRKEAQQSIKTTLALSEIAKKEEFKVDEGKYQEVLQNISNKNNKSVAEIEELIKRNNSRENIEYELLLDQAMDFIYEQGKVKKQKPITLDEFIHNPA